MTFVFRESYRPKVELRMRNYFESLSEKDRRRYAGAEAIKFERGGTAYLSRVLGCSEDVVRLGLKEIKELPHDPVGDRIRRPEGGRKKSQESMSWITGGAKPDTIAVRGVLKKDTLAIVHVAGHKPFERLRFIGFTNSQTMKFGRYASLTPNCVKSANIPVRKLNTRKN